MISLSTCYHYKIIKFIRSFYLHFNMNTEHNSTQIQAIKEFVDSYWPLPDHLNEKIQLNDISDIHEAFLKNKYSANVLIQHKKLCKNLEESWSLQKFQALLGHSYKTGLSLDIHPYTTLRTRGALDLLLKNIINNQPRAMVDFGSGDGLITIGLALHLSDIEKIYAVEINEHGIKRLEDSINKLEPETKKIAASKIIPIHGDYTSEKIKRYIKTTKPDLELFAFPMTPESYINTIVDTIKADSKIFTIYDQEAYGQPIYETENNIISEHNRQSMELGIGFFDVTSEFFTPTFFNSLCKGRKNN